MTTKRLEAARREAAKRVIVAPSIQHRCDTFEEACARCGTDALGREDRIVYEDGTYNVVNYAYWERWFNSQEFTKEGK